MVASFLALFEALIRETFNIDETELIIKQKKKDFSKRHLSVVYGCQCKTLIKSQLIYTRQLWLVTQLHL